MIINTGSRTDIPAYYSEWFYNRIKEKYVCTRNPYYPEQILRYVLSPEVVDLICFCTKNPDPMLERLDEIQHFGQFWFVTITPYEKEIEPYVPAKEQIIRSFQILSQKIGKKRIGWRYDPIFLSEKYTLDFHVEQFEKMAGQLSGYTNQCVISFIDLYEKTKRNFPQVKEVGAEERALIGEKFAEIGRKYDITIRSCCEGADLARFGIDISGCMTKEVLEAAKGCEIVIPRNKKSPRAECNCLLGSDIGMYNTCGHGCVYCYANYDSEVVKRNMRLHNPKSPLLIGEIQQNELIRDAKQVPFCSGQMKLDFY